MFELTAQGRAHLLLPVGPRPARELDTSLIWGAQVYTEALTDGFDAAPNNLYWRKPKRKKDALDRSKQKHAKSAT